LPTARAVRGSAAPSIGVPTNFTLLQNFTFDTRGNREFVDTYDALLNPVTTDSYSPNDDTNLYDHINGLSYTFDANQHETFDPTTGMHKAYDYMGRLVAEDRDSGGHAADGAVQARSAVATLAPAKAKRRRGF
jgi:hypothetical protein